MSTNNKATWRTAWIDEFVASCPGRECNFFTLPGPQALDLKEMRTKATVRSEILVEKSKACTKVLYDSISEPDTKEAAATALMARFTAKPVILNVKFETLLSKFSTDLKSLLERRFAPVSTAFCLDFCGMYIQKQHEAVTRFVELTSALKVLRGQTLWYILNFLSPYTFRGEGERLPLNKLKAFEGLEVKGFRAIHYPSVQDAIKQFGYFLEGTVPQILQDAKLKEEIRDSVEIHDPLHYQNGGGKVAVGYTTNIFTLKGV